MHIIIQLITAFLGALGFCLIFKVRWQFGIIGAINGMIGWGIYLWSNQQTHSKAISMFIAAACLAVFAEILARVLKAPSTVFFTPAVIPLIPGSTLYYTMASVVSKDWDAVGSYGMLTLQYALGIAAGMSLAWAMCDMLRKVRRKVQKSVLHE